MTPVAKKEVRKMQKPTKRKTIKLIALAIAACVVLLMLLATFMTSSSVQKEIEAQDVDSQLTQTQETLDENVSQVPDLTAQLMKLSEENRKLQSVIFQKTAENEKLEGQVKELNSAISTIEADLDAMVKSEYIALLVERLRNPAPDSTENP
jgi:peptidoglycan hydrolase CwlO-like protein